MKKLILSAATLMLASALSFAGTPETKGEAKPEAKTEMKANTQTADVLHWYSPSGTPVFRQSNTIDDEEMETAPCERNKTGCERGYRDDQLNTPGVPSSGVKPGEINLPAATLGQQ
ncbi:hypothetical protein [Sphingobacterium siyangense]|uniref:hypothetical protein n=2 Tax=Sphingobacterium TaxID=28453 RepID=UPI003018C676